jgi:hypothetical protein
MDQMDISFGVYFVPVLYIDETAYNTLMRTVGTQNFLSYKEAQWIPSLRVKLTTHSHAMPRLRKLYLPQVSMFSAPVCNILS